MRRGKLYTLKRPLDLGYGITLGVGFPIRLHGWNDEKVRISINKSLVWMEREFFEYLVYDD